MPKFKPQPNVQVNARIPLSLREFLETEAKERCFGSVQELILSVLRDYKESQEKANANQLLQRLSEWDVMDSSADGEYWRKEIEKVLGEMK